jgi:site-specific recombinase XerD
LGRHEESGIEQEFRQALSRFGDSGKPWILFYFNEQPLTARMSKDARAKAQKLSAETIRKCENLLNRRFLPWCESKGYRRLKQLGVEELRQFRATWTDSAIYATKNLEWLRAFFRLCMHDDWIAKNPARAVKAPQATDKPTLPFSRKDEADSRRVRPVRGQPRSHRTS